MSWQNCNQFLVKEHVALIKAASCYDVFDAQTQQKVLECREERLGLITKLLRFTDYKRMTPFNLQIRRPDGELVLEVKRGIALFLSDVTVSDGQGRVIGGFHQKFFSIGGKFSVHNEHKEELCMLKGSLTGWNFQVIKDGQEYAQISKKWAGVGKELFTSADNYMIQIAPGPAQQDALKKLILAAAFCIDLVLKE